MHRSGTLAQTEIAEALEDWTLVGVKAIFRQ
jgi:hypothetical protein